MMGISLYIKLCNFITTHLYIPISIYIYITTHLYIPYLTYCNIVWSSTYVTMQPKKNSSFTEKRVVAYGYVFLQIPNTVHTLILKILDIFKLNSFHIGKFMFLYHPLGKKCKIHTMRFAIAPLNPQYIHTISILYP